MRFSKIWSGKPLGPPQEQCARVARSYCCQTRMATTGARVLHRRLPRTAALGRPSEHSVCECEAPPADPVRVQPSLCHYLSAREMGNDASTKSSRAYVQLALPPTLKETELNFLYDCPLARDTQLVDKFFSVVRKSIRVHAPLERKFLTAFSLVDLDGQRPPPRFQQVQLAAPRRHQWSFHAPRASDTAAGKTQPHRQPKSAVECAPPRTHSRFTIQDSKGCTRPICAGQRSKAA